MKKYGWQIEYPVDTLERCNHFDIAVSKHNNF